MTREGRRSGTHGAMKSHHQHPLVRVRYPATPATRTPRRRAAAAAAIAAAVALVTWGIVATRGGTRQPGQAPVDEILVKDATPRTGLILGVSYEPRTPVSIIDPASQVVRGTVIIGYTPWVVTRPGRQELLVSQAFGPQPGDIGPTLRIFDLNDLSRPPRVIPMPERSSQIPVTYSPSMALSADGRLLYYEKRRSQCPGGGNAASCDVPAIAVIDLDSGTEVNEARLPAGCAPALLRPLGGSDVLAMCEQGSGDGGAILTRVSPSGSTRAAEFSVRVVGGNQQRVDEAGVAADGAYYVVYRDGGVAFSNGRVIPGLIPAGARLGLDTVARIGGAGTLFAYGSKEGAAYDSLLLFKTDDPAVSRQITLPFGVSHVAPIDERYLALLPAVDDNQTAATRIVVFDLRSQTITGTEIAVPAGAQWLVGD